MQQTIDLERLPARARRAFEYALSRAHVPAMLAPADVPPSLAPLAPSPDDERDIPYVWSNRPLLNRVDLRGYCPPIENQLSIGSCTAQASVGACEFFDVGALEYVAGVTDLSRLFVYKRAREMDGFTGDSGAVLRSALKVCQKQGAPYESLWPYDIARFDMTIPDGVAVDALSKRLVRYERVDRSFADERVLHANIRAALNDGMPVACAGYMLSWFYNMRGPVESHPAQRLGQPASIIGAHAMLIVGYDEAAGIYFLRNSWGPGWGDAGYYGMPFADVGMFFEFWAVRGFRSNAVNWPAYDLDCPQAQAARLYRAALGRHADGPGLDYQTRDIAVYGHLQVARNFMASPEFQRRYGTSVPDEAFVTLLYRNVLEREPDAAGYAYQLAALRNGLERAQLLINFAESPENRGRP